METLRDSFGRKLETLRVSLTDRCDLRCLYCMPAQGARFVPRPELLSGEELLRSIQAFVSLGLKRIKFTGGEPLLRPELEDLVAAFSDQAELGLTTNGTLLSGRAAGLYKAGLRRLTVSLDSLNPARYAAITRGGDVRRVLEGLQAAQELGFSPIKINAVLLDQPIAELLQLAALSISSDWEIRFIEAMPVSAGLQLETGAFWSGEHFKAELERAFGALENLERERSAAPASLMRLKGARGRLGFISSVSQPFCSACDRLRLQANGFLRLCMARPEGLDLKPLLRGGASQAELSQAIREAAWLKPSGHAFASQAPLEGSQMSSIGG
jgi:cyclic pyranopterin phosphate synthase